MSSYCEELVNDFNTLIDDLTPTYEFCKEARMTANAIFQELDQQGPFQGVRIGRRLTAGSIGKGTAIFRYDENGEIKYPDLDLVVYVNEWEPPFKEVYDIFEEILEPLGVTNIKQTKFSLQFDIPTESHGDLSVDLLAAENLVVNTWPYAGCDIGEIEAKMASLSLDQVQQNSVLETNCVDHQENKLASSAFSEKAVTTIRNFVEDEFVLHQVFLAKNWLQSVDLSEFGYISGKSAMAEAIAIVAQNTRRSNRYCGRTCVISGFRRFLEKIERFRKLNICFDDISTYQGKPFIQNPGNKWDNFATGMAPDAMKFLERQARKTLKILQNVRNKEGYYNMNENVIDAIFDHKY